MTLAALLACSDVTSDQQDNTQIANNDVTITSSASNAQVEDDVEQQIRASLIEAIGPVPIQKVAESEMPGVYEVIAQGQVIYVSADRKFIFPGPLMHVKEDGLVNLSQASLHKLDQEKAPERAKQLGQIAEADKIIFKSPNEKYVINVFTDVDCAYCRKLHQNMAGYLERGITIQYLAFPRAGVGSGAYNKLVSVWCSENKQTAMDEAKLKNKFDPRECENPVASQYSLTRVLGLSGTPALLTPEGDLISGFLEPEKLLDYLEQTQG